MTDNILSNPTSPRKANEILTKNEPQSPQSPDPNADEDGENLENLDGRGETSSSGGVLM